MTPRFAIAPSVAHDEILEVARAEGWVARSMVPEPRADAPPQIVWTTGVGEDTVSYVEDDLLDVRYVLVDGPGHAVRDTLSSRGMIFSAAEVAELAEAAETPQELLAATCYVGIAAGQNAAPDLLRALRRALDDTHAEVRRVAVLASAYAGWPELLPRLEQIERDDPDPEAKRLAGRVAASLRGSSGDEGNAP